MIDALSIGGSWIGSYEAVLDGSVLEQHARGYAQDIVFHSQLLVVVNVDLDELDLARILFRQGFDGGRDHIAGSAPVGVEVDKHWNLGSEHG